MTDVSNGPVSTLPGYTQPAPDGMRCDSHADRLAVTRIQGETDSFGAEYHDVCSECVAGMIREMRADTNGVCDWCNREAVDLANHRDFEEGFAGRVYRVCLACRRNESAQLAAEDDE